MYREIAVEPAAVARWKDLRYVADQCGWEHGRLISEYPRRWAYSVRAAAESRGCKDLELKRIQARLEELVSEMLDLGRGACRLGQWAVDVFGEHQRRPFDAIITEQRHPSCAAAIPIDDLSAADPRWQARSTCQIERTPQRFAECFGLLLRSARQVLFVDPYFDADEQRYRAAFERLFAELRPSSELRAVEIHCAVRKQRAFETKCRDQLPALIPDGVQVTVHRWNAAKQMHARYILTELGGVGVDHGLDCDCSGHTDVNLLTKQRCQELLDYFDQRKSPLTPGERIQLTGQPRDSSPPPRRRRR